MTPTGPKGLRHSERTRQPNRGGIQNRNITPARVDKDGDLVMEAAASGRGGRAGRSGRGTAVRGSALHDRQGIPDSPRNGISTRPKRSGIDTTAIQKAVLRGMGSKEPIPKGPRGGLKSLRARETADDARGRLDRISVWGLKKSKAASNQDGGISDLIGFIERKATHTDPAREAVVIKKSRMEGDALIISVRPEDTPKILRINNFVFAGSQLTIEGPPDHAPLESNADAQTPNTIEVLKAVLNRRYDVEAKLLDLSQIGSDPQLINIGMFNSTSREPKFFPALMKVCEGLFKSEREKEDAVVSISLANNGLLDLLSVTTLSQTFPALKNLDISNNLFPELKALQGWRWKFRKLQHLVLSGNPLETKEPNYKEVIMKWYPTVTLLNNIQIRSQEEISAVTNGKMPLPILGPSFRDEGAISENFVKQFFPGYDSDRIGLANGFYDAQSTFSLSVNTSALRASEDSASHSPANWDRYIKRSRNLTKVTTAAARIARLYTGTDAIRDCFVTLPATRHPDLLAEPQKWCIECHTLPGIPDPARQSASGVGGLMVMAHGEFFEIDISTNKTTVCRSFDRTFVLGPGGGIGGVRVVSDTLVLRAYGGFEAWRPEEIDSQNAKPSAPSQHVKQYQIPVPNGFGVSLPGKAEELVQKEIIALELSKATGMTLEYSGMCLQQSDWNLEGAGIAFEQAKGSLPAAAFVHPS